MFGLQMGIIDYYYDLNYACALLMTSQHSQKLLIHLLCFLLINREQQEVKILFGLLTFGRRQN